VGLASLAAPAITPAWAASSHRHILSTPHQPSLLRVAHRTAQGSRAGATLQNDPIAPTAPRAQNLRQQLPISNAVINGTWTALGADPIRNEVSLCTQPPNLASCGSFGNASGRITSLVADPTNAQVAYAGSAGGGVWKTTNGGASWTALTDTQPSLAIGALAISPSGQIIYAGTGEDNTSESQAGQGILVSKDGGASWTLSGQPTFAGHHIGGIAIDRSNPQHVLAASDIGLYVMNTDGLTWSPLFSGYQAGVLAIPGQTASGGVRQIIQDPDNVSKYWLSVSDDCLTEAGDVMVSSNSGSTFSSVTPLALTQNASRIGLAVGRGGVAYYSAAGCSGNLIDLEKTASGASSWTQIYSAREYNPHSSPPTSYSVTLSAPGLSNYFNFGGSFGQGGYDNAVAVDPTDSGHAVFGGVTVLSTTNGGSSFVDTGRAYDPKGIIHPDYHAFAFTSHDHLYAGNDGGVYKTSDLGGVGEGGDWTNLNSNLDTIQYYNGTALDAAHILGGAQDNGSPGNFPGSGSLPEGTQYLDGDGTVTALDPHSTAAWAAYPSLGIFKGDSTAPVSSFGPASPCVGTSDPACGDPTDFVAPYVLDPSNSQRLIAGTNRVWYSGSGGVPAGSSNGGSWSAISGPLTNPSYANIDALTVLAMTPSGVTGAILTGSRAGKVFQRTQPGSLPSALTWADISAGLPPFPGYNAPSGPTAVEPNAWITGIAINPSNAAEAWVTIGGLHVAHIWHTATLTTTPNWSSIDGTGPNNVPDVSADAVAFDAGSNTLYVGTETGILLCSTCSGLSAATTASWSTLGGLPNVKVNALTFTQSNELVAWTHGRGAWALLKTSPALFVTPGTVSVTCQRGTTTAPPQVITVSNRGGGTLSWTVSNNSNPVVTASPSVGMLAAGTSQPVNVTATCPSSAGVYPATLVFGGNGGSPTVPVSVVATYKGQYTPLPPARILDTRIGLGHAGAIATQPVKIMVAGAPYSGVPSMTSSTPPSAAVINVTATNTSGAPGSYLTVYPGPSQPTASNLNWSQGQTVANLVEVALATDGSVTVFNAAGTADVIFDVQGWVSTPGAGPANPSLGLYNPVVPGRILDTRTPLGGHNRQMVKGEIYTLQVAGTGQGLVPPSGANSVVLNLTETNLSGTALDYLTVYPSDASQPFASNLNFSAGETRANRVIVKLGATGAVKIFNALGSVDVIVDVGGWFTDGIAQTSGARFTGLSPSRILDSRDGASQYTLALGPGSTYSPIVAGRGGVPPMDAVVPPTAVVMNVTSTDTTAASFLTVYPSDATLPLISDLNWPAGATIPNLVVVKLSPDGRANLYNPGGSVDVIADVVGWYG